MISCYDVYSVYNSSIGTLSFWARRGQFMPTNPLRYEQKSRFVTLDDEMIKEEVGGSVMSMKKWYKI